MLGSTQMHRNGYANFDHHDQHHIVNLDDDDNRVATSSSSPAGYIEHHVSKMDTLAGVAIKYGVEVSDVKKLNSLVTDHQMFALKTLQIPLPGRHPPSPCLSNCSDSPGCERTPPSSAYPDLLDSFQSIKLNSFQQPNVSPAMRTLQGFYRLKSTDHIRNQSEGLEMSSYSKENGPFPKHLLATTLNPPLSRHRKSKSMANGFFSGSGDFTDAIDSVKDDPDDRIGNVLRRVRRPDSFSSTTPEILLKEDPSSTSGGFSAVKGKGLALRSKATSRTCLVSEDEVNRINSTPTGAAANVVTNHYSGVRKSSSTSNLQDQESGSSSTWLTSKWNLTSDIQALSAAAITRPIFDGLPKPITGRKNKAALD